MGTSQKKPGQTALRILEVLRENPQGLTIAEIRELILAPEEVQQHLDRRLRELDPFFIIRRSQDGRKTVYVLVGPRPEGEWRYEKISKEKRAQVLSLAGSRCQMCGRTVEDDKITLHVDHKIPESWGGTAAMENLWAICSACNEGKKNYFKTFDAGTMTKVMNHESVHKRIAMLLRRQMHEWVDSDLIEFVANFQDHQTDWRKRLRELRYLRLVIDVRRVKRGKRSVSQYRLVKWVTLPADPTKAVREYECKRAEKNRRRKEKE